MSDVDQPVQTETSNDNLTPPGAPVLIRDISPADHAVLQVTKLAEFLVEHFPNEIDWANRQVPETPVDTAIRLLLAKSAKVPAAQWCQTEYCNFPAGHQGPHGWIESSG